MQRPDVAQRQDGAIEPVRDAEGYVNTMSGLGVDVSRETLARLEQFAGLLASWQKAINLVSRSTLDEIWHRHFLDSAQLLPLMPESPSFVDLGSGGGFPGLVLAIHRPHCRAVLVEADLRKATFLREAARSLQLPNLTVLNQRIEAGGPQRFPLITARALASLERLLGWAEPWKEPTAICLFHKGIRAQDELTEAERGWKITCQTMPSLTEPGARIIRIDSAEKRSS